MELRVGVVRNQEFVFENILFRILSRHSGKDFDG